MTASKLCKESGFHSLKELELITGVPTRTLQDWHNKKPKLFKIVLKGAKFQRIVNEEKA